MKEIKLTQGYKATVDDEDFGRVSAFKWYALVREGNPTYAGSLLGGKKPVLMHRVVLGLKESSLPVDHINGDGLDNRKRNLRVCTHQQNMFNMKRNKKNTSGYKGVCFSKDHKAWKCRIKLNGKYVHIGYFKDKVKAAEAYDEMAKELFGEYARPNFK